MLVDIDELKELHLDDSINEILLNKTKISDDIIKDKISNLNYFSMNDCLFKLVKFIKEQLIGNKHNRSSSENNLNFNIKNLPIYKTKFAKKLKFTVINSPKRKKAKIKDNSKKLKLSKIL